LPLFVTPSATRAPPNVASLCDHPGSGRHARRSEEMHAPHWFIYCWARDTDAREQLIRRILIA